MKNNNKKPFLSVIVPVYNAETYVSQCIRSIQLQTWTDLEIIIIDDGSTDNSSHICNMFAQNDKRIMVYHIPNKGSVHARKMGVKYASGKYIGFVDSDDWIDSIMYQQMCSSALQNDADTVICDVFRYVNNDKVLKWTQFYPAGIYTQKDAKDTIFSTMLYTGTYYEFGFLPCVWNKIIRKDVIERYIYQIDEKITIGDDVCLTLFCLWQSEKIVYLKNQYLYFYRDTQNSITKQSYICQIEHVINLLDYLDQEILNVDKDKILRKQFEYYVTLMVSNVIFELYSGKIYHKKQREHILDLLRACHSIKKMEKNYQQMKLPNMIMRAMDILYQPRRFSEIRMFLNIFTNALKK